MRHSLSITLLSALGAFAQAPVPPEYQGLYNTLNTQISGFDAAVNAGWNRMPYAYLNAPQLQSASSDEYTTLLGTNYYSLTVIPQLNDLVALGAKAVTVHLNFPIVYQPFYASDPAQYQSFTGFYQQLAQEIRGRGLKLVVESAVGIPISGNQVNAFQPYFKSLSWTEYITGRAENALEAAQLMQPDYMTVLTEPDSEADVTGQSTVDTPSGAAQLVSEVLSTLQRAGVNNVPTGAGAGTWTQDYSAYLESFAVLPMDFIDMHIYPINNGDFTNALSAADTIRAAGKQVAISECWPWKVTNSELGTLSYAVIESRDPFSFWAPIDTAFLQAVVDFAQYKQLAFVAPFWTNYFSNYLDYATYGSLPIDTILTDADSAATDATRVGTYTSTGVAWLNMVIPSPDKTPPDTPATPTVSSLGTTGVTLQWTMDYDNVGVSAYHVYRDGSLAGSTSVNYYYDSGLDSGMTYTYTLTASDASGNVSGMSEPLTVTTYK